MVKRRGRPPHDDLLTPAEWRTVDAVRHGLTNREIAARRGISVDAVKFHVANAVGKLGIGSRQALKHWRGAPRASAIHSRGGEMTEAAGIQGLGQVARSVGDVGRAEAWYRDVLGLTHLFTFDKLAFFQCGATRLMLAEGDVASTTESLLYFEVEDIDAAHRRLLERGVEFLGAPHMIHRHADGVEEWMAFFEDPEGRPLAIMARVEPE